MRSKAEEEILELLDHHKISYIHDRKLSDTESLLRPDFLIKKKNYYIIIEVDERQHRERQNETERMRTISANLDKPVYFIRYNPDRYRGSDGHYIDTPTEIRHQRLLSTIKSLRRPLGSPRLIYLYYDGDSGKNNVLKLDSGCCNIL